MGGEVLLMMEKGEIPKVKKFIGDYFPKDADGAYFSTAPNLFGEREIGCWIEFRGGSRIQVGYQASNLCSEWPWP